MSFSVDLSWLTFKKVVDFPLSWQYCGNVNISWLLATGSNPKDESRPRSRTSADQPGRSAPRFRKFCQPEFSSQPCAAIRREFCFPDRYSGGGASLLRLLYQKSWKVPARTHGRHGCTLGHDSSLWRSSLVCNLYAKYMLSC
jgi:hypothetical protein